MVLTDEERTKFADYCAQQAADNQALIKQMEQMSVPEGIFVLYRQIVMAFMMVEKHLRKTE